MGAAIIAISIVLIVTSGTAAIVASYVRRHRHRTDAVAMAVDRELAGRASASPNQAGAQIARLTVACAPRLPAQ